MLPTLHLAANGDPVLDLNPVDVAGWSDWRPVWEDNESFKATLDLDSDATDALTSTRYVFTLEETSRYPGYCMNAGNKNDTSFDIIFRVADQPSSSILSYTVSNNGQTLTVKCIAPVTSLTVTVFVKDYAAHSILHAQVFLNDKKNTDGTEKDGTPSNNNDAEDRIAIPLDNNGNDIADGWHGGGR